MRGKYPFFEPVNKCNFIRLSTRRHKLDSTRSTIQELLTRYWGHASFRPLQQEIIESVLDGNDTLALLTTGGGKSVCFQVPALAREGICLVISPLIALMKDQVENLRKKGIAAHYIVSGMTRREIDIVLDNCIYGNIRFLYISPERLSSDILLERVKKMHINLIAVDEAHCISQWGYDFRPSYLKIAEVRELIKAPVLALTATATPEVKKDIQEKLLFKKEHVFQDSFLRKNLSYVVFYEENKAQRMLNIIQKMEGSGIVYVRNRRKTQELAVLLSKNKIKADFYHAGLNMAQRSQKQDDWKSGKTRMMVSTNAFGMGIDKPDVRLVIHYDMPESLEAYYQEAGRGGRDGKKAYAVLLYNNTDKLELEDRINQNFPDMEFVKSTYQALANFFQVALGAGEGQSYDLDINQLCNTYNLHPLTTYSSLHLLEMEGLIAMNDSFFLPSRVHIKVSNEELYAYLVAHADYDHFIKIILRSYAGSFEGYVNINERELARRAEIPLEKVNRFLNQLHLEGILVYLPQKDMPQVIFTMPRKDAKTLTLSKQSYEDRKKRYTIKAKAVIDYATRKSKCRSQLLLGYFGETDSKRCGICDVCIGRNKLDMSEYEFSLVKDQLKSLLAKEPMLLVEVMKGVRDINEDKAMKAIQWLIDTGKLRLSDDNLLHYKE